MSYSFSFEGTILRAEEERQGIVRCTICDCILPDDCEGDLCDECFDDMLTGESTLAMMPKMVWLQRAYNIIRHQMRRMQNKLHCIAIDLKYIVRHALGMCDYCGKHEGHKYDSLRFLCPKCSAEEDEFQRSLLDTYDGE